MKAYGILQLVRGFSQTLNRNTKKYYFGEFLSADFQQKVMKKLLNNQTFGVDSKIQLSSLIYKINTLTT